MYSVAIFRNSAAFQHPPGRADQLSVLKKSTQRKMRAEAVRRSSSLEKCFWESSSGKKKNPDQQLLNDRALLPKHQAAAPALCTLLLPAEGWEVLRLSLQHPKAAAPWVNSCCWGGRLCSQGLSFLFERISHGLSPGSIHYLPAACVLSFGFSLRNFAKPRSEVWVCLSCSALFAGFYVPGRAPLACCSTAEWKCFISYWNFMLLANLWIGFPRDSAKLRAICRGGRQGKSLASLWKWILPCSASVRFVIPFTCILLWLSIGYLFFFWHNYSNLGTKNIYNACYEHHFYYTSPLSRNTGRLKGKWKWGRKVSWAGISCLPLAHHSLDFLS